MKNKFRYSFRLRLMVCFMAISLIPLFLCSVLLVQIANIRTNDQTRREMEDRSAGLLICLDRLSQGLEDTALHMQGNDALAAALAGDSSQDTLVYSALFTAADDIRNYCSLHIYDLSGQLHYSTQNTPSKPSMNTYWGVLNAALDADGIPVYRAYPADSDDDAALLQAAVLLKDESGQSMCYLVMELTRDHFWELFSGKYGTQDDLLLLNRFWRPIYSSQHTLSDTLAEAFRTQLLNGDTPGAGDPDYIFSITQHEATGLFLLLQHPQAFNKSTMQILYTVNLFCALICIVISVLVSLLLSQQISSPIRHLQRAFGKLEQDDLSVQVSISRQDELGQLAQEFNHMVNALKSNREELVSNQKALNEAKIRMLQAQLNPHFLCNTLDTMKWISKINKVPQVALMSTNLADILRFCISDEEFVPLQRELEVLKRYVEIQRIRLSDSFAFLLHIPKELESCLVPKMILQPIVENAIIHGLSGIDNSAITVDATVSHDMLRITITDNGHGLPEEMAGKPYSPEKALKGNHLGLYNVDTILKIHYGDDFGLFLDKGPDGIGTTVTATLPIRRKEESQC